MLRMVQDPDMQGRYILCTNYNHCGICSCEVEASLTETSNLEIVFHPKGSSDDDTMHARCGVPVKT